MNKPKTKPAKRMLVEDADAASVPDEEGRQHIRKTADRKAEAERQGVDESQL